jgi:hypothetical protein
MKRIREGRLDSRVRGRRFERGRIGLGIEKEEMSEERLDLRRKGRKENERGGE